MPPQSHITDQSVPANQRLHIRNAPHAILPQVYRRPFSVSKYLRVGLCLLLLSVLSACATTSQQRVITSPEASATTPLELLAEQGQFLDAALAYSRLASNAPESLRQHYALRASELLMAGNYVPQSLQLLNEIDALDLPLPLQIRHALLSADIAMARQRPKVAEATLQRAERLLTEAYRRQLTLGANTLQRFHQLRANNFTERERYLDAAYALTQLETQLTDEEAILANQDAILESLQMLSENAQQILQRRHSTDALNGWWDLLNVAQGLNEAQQNDADLVRWREQYPLHPARPQTIRTLLSEQPRALHLPKKIALMLPLSNRYAKAASAVRDGFLAAYYAQHDVSGASTVPQITPAATHSTAEDAPFTAPGQSRNTGHLHLDRPAVIVPSIRIYDAGNIPENISHVYQRAVDEGAEFIVGPLDKEAVNQLAKQTQLSVPVLALNYSEQQHKTGNENLPSNLFQLSLSPEQEARQVAERAWLDGHSRAAIITPSSAWGKRVAKAFSKRWRQLGGRVVEKQTYNAQKSDYSLPIRRLLNVDESQKRKKALRRLLGEKLEFIPRRRQDIDFIFMAAASKQARLIKPQLRFHHAPKVPVYSTSHSYSGSTNANMDRDMDGVLFCDMPWALNAQSSGQNLKTDIEAIWPNASKRYSRLFALGVDAYRVIAELNTLRRNRAAFYRGETGDLYLDMSNRLQRRLSWARFERGIAQPLKDF
jgi:uncharacterized protein